MELIGWSISSCGFLQSSESALWDPYRILHSGELPYNDCWTQVSWSSLNPISKIFLGNSRFIYQNLCSVFLNEPSILAEQSKKYKFSNLSGGESGRFIRKELATLHLVIASIVSENGLHCRTYFVFVATQSLLIRFVFYTQSS